MNEVKKHKKIAEIPADDRAKLDELAAYLYQHETIAGEEFMGILNG